MNSRDTQEYFAFGWKACVYQLIIIIYSVSGSSLNYTGGFLSGNRVQYNLDERNKYGLGGGIYISNNSFILEGLDFINNSAYFGGAIFASSNFALGGSFGGLTFAQNNALLGDALSTDQAKLISDQ